METLRPSISRGLQRTLAAWASVGGAWAKRKGPTKIHADNPSLSSFPHFSKRLPHLAHLTRTFLSFSSSAMAPMVDQQPGGNQGEQGAVGSSARAEWERGRRQDYVAVSALRRRHRPEAGVCMACLSYMDSHQDTGIRGP